MVSRIDQIYQEGARLFAQKGFEATSLRDVASACGISMAAIYYHFATKEELHDEITQCCFEDFLQRIVQQKNKLPPSKDKPSTLLGSIFDAIMEDWTLFNLLQRDLQYLNDDMRNARTRERQEEFFKLISDSIRKAWGRQPDATTVLLALGLIAGYCELLQRDARLSGPQRTQVIAHHRGALIRMVELSFDRPTLGLSPAALA